MHFTILFIIAQLPRALPAGYHIIHRVHAESILELEVNDLPCVLIFDPGQGRLFRWSLDELNTSWLRTVNVLLVENHDRVTIRVLAIQFTASTAFRALLLQDRVIWRFQAG